MFNGNVAGKTVTLTDTMGHTITGTMPTAPGPWACNFQPRVIEARVRPSGLPWLSKNVGGAHDFHGSPSSSDTVTGSEWSNSCGRCSLPDP